TYGVRAGQLSGLRLEDVHWRDARITFPAAKRGRLINAPLTAAVGDALLQYMREGRPNSGAREVFLSSDPPFQPLAAGSVYNVVCRPPRQSAITSPHQGSHAIRHAWATRALAQGQRLKTIADLLGHRSIESTRIYTKVDYAQLRSVRLPRPGRLDHDSADPSKRPGARNARIAEATAGARLPAQDLCHAFGICRPVRLGARADGSLAHTRQR